MVLSYIWLDTHIFLLDICSPTPPVPLCALLFHTHIFTLPHWTLETRVRVKRRRAEERKKSMEENGFSSARLWLALVKWNDDSHLTISYPFWNLFSAVRAKFSCSGVFYSCPKRRPRTITTFMKMGKSLTYANLNEHGHCVRGGVLETPARFLVKNNSYQHISIVMNVCGWDERQSSALRLFIHLFTHQTFLVVLLNWSVFSLSLFFYFNLNIYVFQSSFVCCALGFVVLELSL